MAIDPTGRQLKAFLEDDPDQPVTMLNLLRFVAGGDQGYADYLRHFRPYAERVGATVVYYGLGTTPLVADPGAEWDAVLLVAYPSRRAFAEMVRDPGYQTGTRLRTRSLVAAVLQPTVDASAAVWSGPAPTA